MVDRSQVGVYGAGAYVELLCHLSVGEPLRDEAMLLDLAGAESSGMGRSLAGLFGSLWALQSVLDVIAPFAGYQSGPEERLGPRGSRRLAPVAPADGPCLYRLVL